MRVAGFVEVLDGGFVDQHAVASHPHLHGALVVPLDKALQMFPVFQHNRHLGLLLHLLLEVEGFGVRAFECVVRIGDRRVG